MSKASDDGKSIPEKIKELLLWQAGDRLLVAVSGGIDSMVLLHALMQLDARIDVAHVNYGLRAEASDADEDLVATYCRDQGIKVHVRKCQPEDRKSKDRNMQLWARNLRYHWFLRLIKTKGYAMVVTAHHQDDQVETILYRLTRGSGLRGISGMRHRDGHVCRPLLNISKKEIASYARQHQVPYREDASNASLDYDRNYIRHHIIPHFQELKPAFNKRLAKNAHDWQMASDVLVGFLKKALALRLEEKPPLVVYALDNTDDLSLTLLLLRHWLGPLGFSSDQMTMAAQALIEGRAGQKFVAGSWNLACNRQQLHLSKMQHQSIEIALETGQKAATDLGVLSLKTVPMASFEWPMITDPQRAYLDHDKVELPIVVRNWRPGDFFYPLGVGGKKKVKKYLREQKRSLLEKDMQLVCTSQDQICWVVEGQIDERFKIDESTKQVVCLRFERR